MKELANVLVRTAAHADILDFTLITRDLEVVEMCAGTAPITRAAIAQNLTGEVFERRLNSDRDLLTATGFRRARALTLRVKEQGLLWGESGQRAMALEHKRRDGTLIVFSLISYQRFRGAGKPG